MPEQFPRATFLAPSVERKSRLLTPLKPSQEARPFGFATFLPARRLPADFRDSRPRSVADNAVRSRICPALAGLCRSPVEAFGDWRLVRRMLGLRVESVEEVPFATLPVAVVLRLDPGRCVFVVRRRPGARVPQSSRSTAGDAILLLGESLPLCRLPSASGRFSSADRRHPCRVVGDG